MPSPLSRRKFLASASLTAGAIGLTGNVLKAENKIETAGPMRQVNIATVSIMDISAKDSKDMVQQVLGVMDQVIPYQPDIICLPETFAYSNISSRYELKDVAEKLPGTVVTPFLNFAATHHCYVICPTYVEHDG